MRLPQSGQRDFFFFFLIISTISPLLTKLWQFWRKPRRRNGEGRVSVLMLLGLENWPRVWKERHMIAVFGFPEEVQTAAWFVSPAWWITGGVIGP